MTESTEELRQQRASTHGDFSIGAPIVRKTVEIWAASPNWSKLDHVQQECLHMIAHKVQRLLTGNQDDEDHWNDIAGYAHLAISKSINLRKGGKAGG